MCIGTQLFPASCKIPLVVGVTGHIDIDDSPEIKDQMHRFWAWLREIAGPDTRFVLLSSCAAGADHLFVKYRPEGTPYGVPLPFAEEEYRKDFKGETLDAFKNDLGEASWVFDCGGKPGDYTLATEYVRNHADVILTLWDGYPSLNDDGTAKKGGTWYQLRMAFGIDDILVPHSEKAHLVVNLLVSRKSGHTGKEEPRLGENVPQLGILKAMENEKFKALELAEGNIPKSFRENVLKPIQVHNAKCKKKTEKVPLLSDNMPSSSDLPAVAQDLKRYAEYNGRAGNHQAMHKCQFKWLASTCLLVGILGAAWSGILFSQTEARHELVMHGVLLLYLLGCFLAWLLGWEIKNSNHYFEQLEERTMAELLRMRIFWKFAGLQKDYGSFSDFLLNHRPPSDGTMPDEEKPKSMGVLLLLVNWEIQDNMGDGPCLDLSARLDNGSCLDLSARLDMVKVLWLEGQKQFCEKKVPKYHCLHRRLTLVKRVFFWYGFGFAAFLVTVFLLARLGVLAESQTTFLGLAYYRELICSLCPFMVAALGWLLERTKWNAIAAQYEKNQRLYGKALEKFINKGTVDKQRIVNEMMQFALREVLDWNALKNDESSRPEPLI